MNHSPLMRNRGRREDRVPAAPAVSCAMCIRNAHEHTGSAGNSPAFPAQWFYGFLRALPGDRLCCHRRPREALASHELDASVGASGPHDFAVRDLRRSSARIKRATTPSRPPHPAPTFVTIAIRPSSGTGRPLKAADLPDKKSRKYFVEGHGRVLTRRGDLPVGLICRRPFAVRSALRDAGLSLRILETDARRLAALSVSRRKLPRRSCGESHHVRHHAGGRSRRAQHALSGQIDRAAEARHRDRCWCGSRPSGVNPLDTKIYAGPGRACQPSAAGHSRDESGRRGRSRRRRRDRFPARR